MKFKALKLESLAYLFFWLLYLTLLHIIVWIRYMWYLYVLWYLMLMHCCLSEILLSHKSRHNLINLRRFCYSAKCNVAQDLSRWLLISQIFVFFKYGMLKFAVASSYVVLLSTSRSWRLGLERISKCTYHCVYVSDTMADTSVSGQG